MYGEASPNTLTSAKPSQSTPVKETERILSELDYSIDNLDRLGRAIIEKLSVLGGFDSNLKDTQVDPIANDCFINGLDGKIFRLRRVVDVYSAVLDNLDRLI